MRGETGSWDNKFRGDLFVLGPGEGPRVAEGEPAGQDGDGHLPPAGGDQLSQPLADGLLPEPADDERRGGLNVQRPGRPAARIVICNDEFRAYDLRRAALGPDDGRQRERAPGLFKLGHPDEK